MEIITQVTLPTMEEVSIEMIVEDLQAIDNQGMPVTIYDRKYTARFPDDDIIILHKENGIWRDDLNPENNGTTKRRNELKTAILDHNL
jgi:hypothetical protein